MSTGTRSSSSIHFGGGTNGSTPKTGSRMNMDSTFTSSQFMLRADVGTGVLVSREKFRTFLSTFDGEEATDGDDGG